MARQSIHQLSLDGVSGSQKGALKGDAPLASPRAKTLKHTSVSSRAVVSRRGNAPGDSSIKGSSIKGATATKPLRKRAAAPALPLLDPRDSKLDHHELNAFEAQHSLEQPRIAPQIGRAPLAACVVIPQLALQLLAKGNAGFRTAPAALVEDAGPQARLLDLNGPAEAKRLRRGMRHGEARNLVPDLRVGVIGSDELAKVNVELLSALHTFSPRVEPAEPGTFFIDASGLGPLYGGPRAWAHAVHEYLKARGFQSRISVGYGRTALLAIAQTSHAPVEVFAHDEATRERANQAPLSALLPANDVDALRRIGVTNLKALLALPADGIKLRFGSAATTLRSALEHDTRAPFDFVPFTEAIGCELELSGRIQDTERLLFPLKNALHQLGQQAAAQSAVIKSLTLTMELDGKPDESVTVVPGRPTRDALLLLDLLRLRMQRVRLQAPVELIRIEVETLEAEGDQLLLFGSERNRDLEAGSRALARIAASFGEKSVCRAELADAHLPEQQFSYLPTRRLKPPRPIEALDFETHRPRLVRNLLTEPKRLSPLDHRAPRRGPRLPHGKQIRALVGPYRVNAQWWSKPIERDYYYAEVVNQDHFSTSFPDNVDNEARLELLWLYFEPKRQRWYLHGTVD